MTHMVPARVPPRTEFGTSEFSLSAACADVGCHALQMQIGRISPAVVAGAVDEDMARMWLSAVHASLRSAHGAGVVGQVRPPGPGWNYYRVRVKDDRGRAVRILLNAAAGLVAASADHGVPENGPLDFCEVPELDSYQQVGLTVLHADVLRCLLRPEQVQNLSESQRADVEYHRPKTIGDLLFNWFD